ncbi:FtsH-binding integral membrane protein [Sphingopyxis sp. OAS728]|nr:FtsH-binding integral membrane protein [Sphingopyxis sp. OAS728]
MRTWWTMLGGLVIWAAHFFALYVIGEFVGTGGGARAAVVLFTLAALAGLCLLVWLGRRTGADKLRGWGRSLGASAITLTALAVVWQALPAFLSQ